MKEAKFSLIEKFIQPEFSFDQPIEYMKKWIEKQQRELNLQLSPDFQRGHVWSQDQEIAYIEFILRGGKSGKDFYFNYPGWMRDWKGEFVCVDGLQRITSILDFFSDKIPAFGFYCCKYLANERFRIAEINFRIHINRLRSKKEVLKWYLEMNSGGTIHTKEELEKVKRMIIEETIQE